MSESISESPSELARFQDAFVAALAGDDSALSPWLDPGRSAAGLSVYRNTVAKGLVDALRDRFPTVERTVGEAWFTAAALDFSRVHPPTRADLSAWGGDFPAWLASFPPASDMPYLADLARLDELWMQAYLAADAAPLAAEAFARLDADGLATARARLHPSARPFWFADGVAEVWRLTRPPAEPPAEIVLDPHPSGLLIVRPDAAVETLPLTRSGFVFLTACAEGLSLAAAADQALSAEPGADFARQFADLIAIGAFMSLEPTPA
jgi:hypothetical protein